MKKSIMTGVFLAALVLFCGCPDLTSYPLEVKEKGSIDNKLLGTWTTSDYSEVKKVRITLNGDKTYLVEVLEEGDDYDAETDLFKAWLAKINKRKFLVLQEMKDEQTTENYYVYDVVIGNNTFTSHTISLAKGSEAISSVKDYQDKVKFSMDSSYFLSTDVIWKKVE